MLGAHARGTLPDVAVQLDIRAKYGSILLDNETELNISDLSPLR